MLVSLLCFLFVDCLSIYSTYYVEVMMEKEGFVKCMGIVKFLEVSSPVQSC